MPEETEFNITVYAKTDVGLVRSGNEDSFLVLNLSTADTWTPEIIKDESPPSHLQRFTQGHYGSILAVTDGMGGALAGEVASRLAVESVRDRSLELQCSPEYSKFSFHERLRLAIELANLYIHYQSMTNSEYTGMGATFTAVGLMGRTAYFAQIGDSRAYVIRNGSVRQITKDQSLVSQLVAAGHITEEEAEQHTYKNVILQALGASPYINVAVDSMPLLDGDTLVLCSDGLSNKMKNEEILEIVGQSSSHKDACEGLIKLANERGGEDNITTLLARVEYGPRPGDDNEKPTQPLDDTWGVEAIPRDPDLPYDVDIALIDDEIDTQED